jgi:glycosyltransferase involved in cell wall biosynthesis
MRIVWLSHGGDLSGAALAMRESVSALVDRGAELHVIVPWPGPLTEAVASVAQSVRVVPYTWWAGPRRRPLAERVRNLHHNIRMASSSLRPLLQELVPDLVVTNTLTIPAGAWAARLAGIPHVWYIHEFGRLDHGLRFDLGERASLALLRRLSRAVLVNSHAVRDHFQPWIPADMMRVVSYAVEVPTLSPPVPLTREPRPFSLILVAYKSPGKRQEEALQAVARLAARGIDVRLTLLGGEDIAYGPFLRTMSAELGIQRLVDFVDFTPDPYSLIAAADVALLCSRAEAFGRVTVEAMKLGKPVIGASSGGTRELIRDGSNGLLYPPGDVTALAHHIETLVRDRALLARLGQDAREWSRRTFTRANHAASLLSALEASVASAAAEPRPGAGRGLRSRPVVERASAERS